ncbi:sulfotransferase family protein [Xanthomonas oryzae pv. oryzicola]|uniref:sulfotransferase family protein n=1 Tax=Xanthomonas oryzae TaxID=347 RepID=UPI003D182A74
MKNDEYSELIARLEGLSDLLEVDSHQVSNLLKNVREEIRSTLWLVRSQAVAEGVDEQLCIDVNDAIFKRSRLPTDTFGDRAAFIIGNRRSGTTLLSYLVGRSEGIAALPENMLCGQFAKSDTLISVAGTVLPRIGFRQDEIFTRFGMMLDDLFTGYARREGKSKWINKELFCAKKLDIVDAMFDYRANFIFIHRHGFDVALSGYNRFIKRDGFAVGSRSGFSLESFLDEWISNNEAILDFARRVGDRCLTLRYQDLVETPDKAGRQIFSFLGEKWPDVGFSGLRDFRWKGYMGDNKIFSRGGDPEAVGAPSEWKRWPAGVLHSLGRRANGTLMRLGYDVVKSV